MHISVSNALAALNLFSVVIAILVVAVHWKNKLNNQELRSEIDFLRSHIHKMLDDVYREFNTVHENIRKATFMNSLDKIVNDAPTTAPKPVKKAVAKKAPVKKTTKNS